MKPLYLPAAIMAVALPAIAHAAPTPTPTPSAATFNGVCAATATSTQAKCTSVAGATGAVTIASTTDASLKVMISAWQSNNSTNAITAANLGAYSGGFGVTGAGDSNGDNNLHQIDNSGGYTDFVMLQFSRAVQLTSATLNTYGISYNGGTSYDSDLSILNLGALMTPPSAWNSSVNLASAPFGTNNTSLWTQTPDGTGSRTAMLNTSAFSQVWLISAAQLPTNNRNDGFKLAQLVVNATPAVPEPATWAMLMIGFGAIGATLRRRSTATAAAIA
jgi:hypothetical protein